ncbi:MAG: hypothetical protein GTN73_01365 [Candidatus Aminicenantes bacterium]|nr:hypothetical protein [Candidatus Aminicenantes bacterium]
MKEKKRSLKINHKLPASKHEKGMALIIVVIVLAFLQVVGLVLLQVTGTGPKVAGNIRTQQQAYNAAEAGFDVAWTNIEEYFGIGEWAHFEGHYVVEPIGIDNPQADNYFRRLSDIELLNLIDSDWDGTSNLVNVIFCRQPYIQTESGLDNRYRYTAFLIDDEAAVGIPDPTDAILVCIGSVEIGNTITTTRLEIELVLERPGT